MVHDSNQRADPTQRTVCEGVQRERYLQDDCQGEENKRRDWGKNSEGILVKERKKMESEKINGKMEQWKIGKMEVHNSGGLYCVKLGGSPNVPSEIGNIVLLPLYWHAGRRRLV